jgi:hypothetical protein
VVRIDFNLACVFADALERELSLLSEKGLEQFVSEGLARFRKDESRGVKFLGLDTRSALETCHRLRTTGVLYLNRRRLSTYLQARCGRPVPVQSMSNLPVGPARENGAGQALVCFDGRTLFLAEEISRFPDHRQNDFLYKALAWIESGLLEFNTFDFDLEIFAAMCPEAAGARFPDRDDAGDLDRFFQAFPDPRIAADLFSVFEYGRVRTLLEKRYPAGAGRYFPLVREEAREMLRSVDDPSLVAVLFAGIALNDEMRPWLLSRSRDAGAAEKIADIFTACTAGAVGPEASAAGIWRTLTGPFKDAFTAAAAYTPLSSPFGLRVRPDLFYAAFAAYEKQAGSVKEKISRLSGESVPRSLIRRRLVEQSGSLSPGDVRKMIQDARRGSGNGDDDRRGSMGLTDLNMDALCRELDDGSAAELDPGIATFRYPEWDHHIGDYLSNHVMVRQREVAAGNTDFYRDTLTRFTGLVKKIRYAFEMLKPEGVTILRKWREGEDFDYRQLLEYAVDKKSGRTPSERIYIKRLKNQRDVAVLLLLDFSRSTSNMVAGSDTTMVLDVEKEALVLFCEALNVTGDAFAIAGFSGTGRLGVDYFQVKSFDEPISDAVRQRIGMVSPQRNTRMGAAIRHATAMFADNTARTRLLIVISDGFPNDIDYKRDYALADTRRSLLEARTKGVIVHSITVNIAGDAKLDDLYGRVRHSVISDVRELPDRLVRIYGRLTG